MIDLAEELIEAKCSYCRGFKFLRGGYECPQCKGTGSEGGQPIPGGDEYASIEAWAKAVWSGVSHPWVGELIGRYVGRGKVWWYNSSRNPSTISAAAVVVPSGGEVRTSIQVVWMYNGGAVCTQTSQTVPILGDYKNIAWVLIVE